MRATNNVPIVFVPGLFGSISDTITLGTGDWNFGMAKPIYEPFVKMLEGMHDQNKRKVFIAFYDWRLPVEVSASIYLAQTIKKVKQQTGSSKVNLVCHSMGGLVARAYVQSSFYKSDVDQLIMLGTPNAGSPMNYCYWSGSKLDVESGVPVNPISEYMKTYLHHIHSLEPTNLAEANRLYFPSLVNLVPSKDYGDYLIVGKGNTSRLLPYMQVPLKNPFLDKLNADSYLIRQRHIDVTLIAGIRQTTPQYVQMMYPLPNGSAVCGTVNSQAGDGNVMVHSAFVLDGDKYLIHANHLEILSKSEAILKKKLT